MRKEVKEPMDGMRPAWEMQSSNAWKPPYTNMATGSLCCREADLR
jgi:hypothetical protein